MLRVVSFPSLYLSWHYSLSLLAYFSFAKNILWFLFHFFSIGLLIRTLPAPWHRLSEDTYGGKGRNVFTDFLVEFLMRLVGFVVRTITITIGVASILISLALLLVFFVIWLLLPFSILIFLVYGFIEILTYVRYEF
jgi:hypothetical protein